MQEATPIVIHLTITIKGENAQVSQGAEQIVPEPPQFKEEPPAPLEKRQNGHSLPPELLKRTQSGERNKMAKLCEDDVREIRRLHSDGACKAALGRMFGVTSGAIDHVVSRSRWAHVL